ncbi:MAG: BatD family protein [Bacteroidota bacterium]
MNSMRNLLFLFALLPGILLAQKVKFEGRVDRTQLGVGEELVVTYESNTDLPDFQTPSFAGFRIISGPNTFTSVEIVNNKVTTITRLSYILTPIREGVFSIGPASITVKGKTYYTQSFDIVVTESITGSISKGSKKVITGINKSVFIVTNLSRDTVYEGEPILITHKIYSQNEIISFDKMDYPAYDGFWTKVMNESRGLNEVDEINGRQFYTVILREVLAYPQKTGQIEVPAMNARVKVFDNSGNRLGEYEYDLKGVTGQLFVRVLPPRNKPVNFNKYVGIFSIESSADKTELKANEAVTISLKISGNGNFDLITAPKLDVPQEIEVFPPKSVDNFYLTPEGISGSKSFEYVLIPRKKGNYTIRPEPFSYFDIKKKDYVTFTAPEIQVIAGEGAASDEDGNTASGPENGGSVWSSPGIYFVIGLPLLALIIFLAVRKRKPAPPAPEPPQPSPQLGHHEQAVHAASPPQRKKTGTGFLELAAEYLMQGQNMKFYDALLKGFYNYLSGKLNIEKAEISRENIREALESRKFPKERTDELIHILDTCEMAKYAHLPAHDSDKRMMALARELVLELERLG